MPTKRMFFFATADDLKLIGEFIDKEAELKGVEAGLFDSNRIKEHLSIKEISDLGIAEYGNSILCKGYLITFKYTAIKIRTIKQNKGGVKFAVDQAINPDSIIFRGGGIYREDCVVGGEYGTISNSTNSIELCKVFSRAIRKYFKGIKGVYLGPEAEILLDKGWRLVQNIDSPLEYDFKR